MDCFTDRVQFLLGTLFVSVPTLAPASQRWSHHLDREMWLTVLRVNVAATFPDSGFKQALSDSLGSIVSMQYCQSVGGWNGDLLADMDLDGCPDWWTRERVNGSQYVTELEVLWSSKSYCGSGPHRVSVFADYLSKVVLTRNPGCWRGWSWIQQDRLPTDVVLDYSKPCKGPEPNDTTYDVRNFASAYDVGPGIYPVQLIKDVNPTLCCKALSFQFAVVPSSAHICSGQFPSGIPSNFFNSTHCRRAFAYTLNRTKYLQEAFDDRAILRETPGINGLYPDYYTKSQAPPYTYDMNVASVVSELQQAFFTQDGETKSVWDWGGFKMDVLYYSGREYGRLALENLKATFDTINSLYAKNFTVIVVSYTPTFPIDDIWSQAPVLAWGYVCDMSDADDTCRWMMHSGNGYAKPTGYTAANGWTTKGPRSGLNKDQLIDLALKTDDGPQRANMYADLDDIYLADCPSVMLAQPSTQLLQQYWVKGTYYSAKFPGTDYYFIYKNDTCWADVIGRPPIGQAYGSPDGHVDMRDVGYVTQHFGAYAPNPSNALEMPPRTIYDARWAPGFYGFGGCDLVGDRKVDMRDIGFVCNHYGHYFEP